MRRSVLARGLPAVALALVLAGTSCGAGPPLPAGKLSQARQKRLRGLEGEAWRAALAGRFADAARKTEEARALRARWQGPRQWQTIDAGLAAESYRRLEKLSEARQKAVGRSYLLNARGIQLHKRGQYREAEASLREALQARREALGEGHSHTALSYMNVAYCLDAQGKHAEALPLYRKALAIQREALGEGHPQAAASCNNMALCLRYQGKPAEALPFCRKALAICREALGEGHPHTAASYDNLASCLNDQGRHGEALPLYRKALAIQREALGEGHPNSAASYNSLATCLDAQGQHAEALPLHQKALAIYREVLGEGHSHTAASYNNLAMCLRYQGKHAEALPLHQKALAIYREALGEGHWQTATSHDNVASCLSAQGKHAEALPLHQKALAIRKKALGEGHWQTATSYVNVAHCLGAQGKHAEALPLYRKALAIRKEALGEGHPHTAASYMNVASCLDARGKHAEALPLHQKALAICREALGEAHPYTATSYSHVAFCLEKQGKWEKAVPFWEAALVGHDLGRIDSAGSGFARSRFRATAASPREALAVAHARRGEAEKAWRYAEEGLGRGLLDGLHRAASPLEAATRSQLARLDERLVPLLGSAKLSDDQRRLRGELLGQRKELVTEMSRRAAARSASLVWARERIQRQLPADGALVLWALAPGDCWACVLRKEGPPRWVRLPGSGAGGGWAPDDGLLLPRLHAALAEPASLAERRQRLLERASKLWFGPVGKLLGPAGKLPAARRLFVVPGQELGRVPVELLAPGYTVSYVASGTVLARLGAGHRGLKADPLLALGDPVCKPRLPWTRFEVESLRRLVGPGYTTALLGPGASEQELGRLAASGGLKKFRVLHLATHGVVRPQAELSALVLSGDGELRVGTILREWKLDADLVVLSACETGLGEDAGGEGLLGFGQALLQVGARSVVLSRWKVDDTATALLMARFYENLLGKRKGLKNPMRRAEALAEAKQWLRQLPRARALALGAMLQAGKLAGTRGTVVTAEIGDRKPKLPKGDKPFSHPAFWAAFTLVGDPD